MYQAGIQVAFINRWNRKRRSNFERASNSGMSTPVSASQVDVPLTTRRSSRWGRRRLGSGRQSFMSQTSQDSTGSEQPFADVEEEFLHAAEFGDIHDVKRILNDCGDLNVDCIDALGRTALRLAVKNEHLEVVEALLEKSNPHHIYEAVLQAISAEHSQIAEIILKHRRYLEMWKERRKLGDTDGFYKTAFPDSQFSPDITPLILAAQKNQFEIVQLLLLRGETIMKPHKFSCGCQECRNKMKFDQLRLAKYRLNAYRGLASEAYISLSSRDPILTAFELAAELRRLSRVEKHFKREYRDLADHLSDYVVKLLDRIRTQKELELVLNKTGKHHQEKFESLARFKMALNFKEKKGAKLLQYPVIKFLCHAISFLMFLILIVSSTIEASQSVSKYRTLRTEYASIHNDYIKFMNKTNNTVYDFDFPLRASEPRVTEILMSLWIIGMVCQECNQIYHTGFVEHLRNFYNLLDFMVISIYISIFTMKYWVIYRVHLSLDALSLNETFQNENTTLTHLYWLNADRIYWTAFDTLNLVEGTFAIANILSFFRISYLLPANETLGPLQISLGRMMKDIAKFLALFVLVILAFMVGLHNLFWYYSERKNIELVTANRPEEGEVEAAKSFGGFLETFRTVFWSLFGRGDPDAVKLGGYKNHLTENIGYILYGAYNVAMVTVLLNMLIAMMSRSFTLIAEDSDREWKFARSLLYMDYIGNGGTLPTPLNIIGAPKALIKMIFCSCCRRGPVDDENEDNTEDLDAASMYPAAGSNDRMGKAREPPRSPLAKDISLDAASGSAHPSDNISITDTRAATGLNNESFEGSSIKSTPRRNQSVKTTLQEEDETLTYQKTMQRIVQRYIFDIQREAEVTEDDFEEIKQDISSIRYDLINQLSTKTSIEEELRANLAVVMHKLTNFKDNSGAKVNQDDSGAAEKISAKPDEQIYNHSSTSYAAENNIIQEDPVSEAEAATESEQGAELPASVPQEE